MQFYLAVSQWWNSIVKHKCNFSIIVGIVGSIYVTKNPKIGGIVLIVSAIWLLISISLFGVLGTILLSIAGLVAVLRK